jgi:hypothetical protein
LAAREPIVQFVALGSALFLLHGMLRPPGAAPGGEIVVSDSRAAALAATFARTWQRPPTRSELEALIDDHILTEVLVREALALGLDRDDSIIRRRLRQKMEFLSEEQAAKGTPSDRDLRAYLAAHPEQFRVEPRLSFRHLFLDPQRRGDDVANEAARLLALLNGPRPPADPSSLGDPLVLVEPVLTGMPKAEVAALLGGSFADELVKHKPGLWVGPIESGYGLHLVKLVQLVPGAVPPLEQIRPQVEREWRAARSSEREEAFYRRLRDKYTITRPEILGSPPQSTSTPPQR